VLVLLAQAQDAGGDRPGARATLERALSEAEAMPDATRPRGYTSRARKLLAEMGGAAE
jgi:hypothetical protein